MAVVLLDVGVSVVDLRILIEGALGRHEELTRLGVVSVDYGRRPVVLRRQLGVVALLSDVPVSVHESVVRVLEPRGASLYRMVLDVSQVRDLYRLVLLDDVAFEPHQHVSSELYTGIYKYKQRIEIRLLL